MRTDKLFRSLLCIAMFGMCNGLYLPQCFSDEIRFGAILGLTGDFAAAGDQFRKGIELASEEINSTGGIKGRSIRVVYEDSQILPQHAFSAASKLVNLDHVVAVLANSMVEVKAAGHMLESKSIPTICLWDSNPIIESMGEYLFSIGVWTPDSGERVADFSYKQLGLRKAAIVKNQDEWAIDVTDTFAKRFKENGGEVLSNDTIDPKETEFRSLLLRIRLKSPDLIYAPLGFNAGTFYKQLRNVYKIPGIIFSSDNIREDVIQAADGALEGAYQTQPADPQTPEARLLEAKYKAHFGDAPNSLLYVAWGYDGLKLLAKAIEVSGSVSGTDIKDALYQVKKLQGASGRIEFTPEGSSKQLVKVFIIKNGKLVLNDVQ